MPKPKADKTVPKEQTRVQAFQQKNTLNPIVFPSFNHEKPARFSLRKKDAAGSLNQNV